MSEEKAPNWATTIDGQQIDLNKLTPEEREHFENFQTIPKPMSEILKSKVQGKRTRFDSAEYAMNKQHEGESGDASAPQTDAAAGAQRKPPARSAALKNKSHLFS
eukprot:TRINITY_DN10647_c0_g1_i1.p1 TRINITY_DN10647_c0_g1~~TRINITY_DN10647_c0_g1_i1.p1  ORF type:complete len:105 (-),score=32.02 TRINITY_DN10647_c0_g1_i1:105-419(-)